MELMRGGKPDPSDKEVERMMELTNDIIRFAYNQKYKSPMERVRAMAMAYGRIMGATANNRAALLRSINSEMEVAREGALLHMKQREDGLVGPRPTP